MDVLKWLYTSGVKILVCILSPFSVFNYSIGSAVLLRASLAVISDWIIFYRNYAYQGAALKITDGSRVSVLMSVVYVCTCAWMRACMCVCAFMCRFDSITVHGRIRHHIYY